MEAELRIPDNIKILSKKHTIGLSPKEKDKYYDKVIIDILNANPTGVSAIEIEKATSFYGRTIRDHLEKLVAVGKAFSVTRSGVGFYFPSGIPEDKPLEIKSKRDGVFYVLNLISNQRGKFVYIQQKELDDSRTLVVKGGIMIDVEDVKDFITKTHTYCAGNKNS